jgi:hypothetical protein
MMQHSRRVTVASQIAVIVASAVVAIPRLQSAFHANLVREQDDFHTFYRTANCLFTRGCAAYEYIIGIPPNLAPPHAHVLLTPVFWLPQVQGYVVWLAISLCALILTSQRVIHELHISVRPLPMLMAISLAAGSGLMMALVSSGQIYAVLTWPVAEAWLAFRKNRFVRGAVFIGVAAAVKPTLLIFIPWFALQGRRREAAIGVTAFVGVFALGILCFGLEPYRAWLNTLAHLPREGHFRDGSVLEALVRDFTPTEYFARTFAAPAIVTPVWAVTSAVLMAITLIRPLDLDRAWLALLAVGCLVAPKGWIYAGWWLAPAAVALWRSDSRWVRALLAIAAFVFWLPDTAPLWGQPNRLLTLTWGSLYLWAWLLLWFASTSSISRSD